MPAPVMARAFRPVVPACATGPGGVLDCTASPDISEHYNGAVQSDPEARQAVFCCNIVQH